MDTKIHEKETTVCRMGSGIPERAIETADYIAEAEMDEEGRLVLPEALRWRMGTAPGRRVWVRLTADGLIAEYGGDKCRICGDPLEPDAPCVICPRCIREVREIPLPGEA